MTKKKQRNTVTVAPMKLVVYGFRINKPSWVVTQDDVKGNSLILASSVSEPRNFVKNESILLLGNNMELHVGDINSSVGELKQFNLYDLTIGDIKFLNEFMTQAGCEFSYEPR